MDIYKPLVALLAIVNPIGAIPFFIHFTQGFTRAQRQRTIRVSAFSAFVVIAVSALAGLKIIEFFGITLASVQVGGGMLLDAGTSIAVVPLAALGVEIMSDGLVKLFPVLAGSVR